MTTVLEAARIAEAVYTLAPVAGWSIGAQRRSWRGLTADGLQAALYTGPGGSVIAYRGTNLALRTPYGTLQDLGADASLGLGQNNNYFSAAQTFAGDYAGRGDVVVCGHSLGGAIAQVVAKRMGFHFVSFNAPGVAVWTRNPDDPSTWSMGAVRTVGMVSSVFNHPLQAVSDMRYSSRPVHGLNVCVQGDPVSPIGVHYGRMKRIPAVALASGESHHSMSLAVRCVAAQADLRDLDVATLS